jgi:hypothetical protein|nr:MAG TPA: hypothetical protein [Caudoviricetes sp.]
MTDSKDQLIPLELTLDDLCWLRAFLKEERLSADADHKKVEALHNEMAIRAAQKMLSREHTQMTKIITAIDETVNAVDAREAIARQIAATVPAEPLAA